MRKFAYSILFSLALFAANSISAENNGVRAKYVAKQGYIANAVNSANHTTLVAAVKVAGLVDTLKGKGLSPVFLRRSTLIWQLLAAGNRPSNKTACLIFQPQFMIPMTSIILMITIKLPLTLLTYLRPLY